MAKYTEAYKAELVALISGGTSVYHASLALGVSESTIRRWCRAAAADDARWRGFLAALELEHDAPPADDPSAPGRAPDDAPTADAPPALELEGAMDAPPAADVAVSIARCWGWPYGSAMNVFLRSAAVPSAAARVDMLAQIDSAATTLGARDRVVSTQLAYLREYVASAALELEHDAPTADAPPAAADASRIRAMATARHWYACQTSALFAFASHGKVWDELNRAALVDEIGWARDGAHGAQLAALADLRRYVETVPSTDAPPTCSIAPPSSTTRAPLGWDTPYIPFPDAPAPPAGLIPGGSFDAPSSSSGTARALSTRPPPSSSTRRRPTRSHNGSTRLEPESADAPPALELELDAPTADPISQWLDALEPESADAPPAAADPHDPPSSTTRALQTAAEYGTDRASALRQFACTGKVNSPVARWHLLGEIDDAAARTNDPFALEALADLYRYVHDAPTTIVDPLGWM